MKNNKQFIIAIAILACLTAYAVITSRSARAQFVEGSQSEDTSTSNVSSFHFLEPIAPRSGDPTKFDPTYLKYLSVNICEISAAGCTTVKTFTAQGSNSEQLRIETSGKD